MENKQLLWEDFQNKWRNGLDNENTNECVLIPSGKVELGGFGNDLAINRNDIILERISKWGRSV